MPTITVGDQDIFYFEYHVTDSALPPVLLIHGAGGQHAHWPPPVRRLPRVQTYAPDLPGHGRSTGPGRSSVVAYAADMLALTDALGVERFIAAGHSMGGAIAQHMALAAPDRVAGLMLVATSARLPVSQAILDNALTDYGKVVDFVVAYGFSAQADDALKRAGRRQLAAISPEVAHGDYAACDAFDTRPRLAEIDIPALVVTGTADRMVPPRFSESLADGLPRAEYVTVEGAGHFLPSERPDELAHIMTRWLDENFNPE